MPSHGENLAILSAAGSRKTEKVIEGALADRSRRVLITTYTNQNKREIEERLHRRAGSVPNNVRVLTWFTFLLSHLARPYQRAVTGQPNFIAGMNFDRPPKDFSSKEQLRYYFDRANRLYGARAADFCLAANKRSDGAVVRRLETVFDHVYVDELQDLVGHDLGILEVLMTSGLHLTLVGDVRQRTLETASTNKNRRFRGAGLEHWLKKRAFLCRLQHAVECFRSNQAICDFADSIYPTMTKTQSVNVPATAHDGVFQVSASEIGDYLKAHGPAQVLRHDRTSRTAGLEAMNFGVSKGSTFDRVVIFPTQPMLAFLRTRDPEQLGEPAALYVAVTRARHSVAFVVPETSEKFGLPAYGAGPRQRSLFDALHPPSGSLAPQPPASLPFPACPSISPPSPPKPAPTTSAQDVATAPPTPSRRRT